MRKSRQPRNRSNGEDKAESSVRVVARMWNNVDASVKAYYTELAKQDKNRYALEVVQWKQEQEKMQNYEDDDMNSFKGKQYLLSAQFVSFSINFHISLLNVQKDFTEPLQSTAKVSENPALSSNLLSHVTYLPGHGAVPLGQSKLQVGSDSLLAQMHPGNLSMRENTGRLAQGLTNLQQFTVGLSSSSLLASTDMYQDPLQDPKALKHLAKKLRKEEVNLVVQLFR